MLEQCWLWLIAAAHLAGTHHAEAPREDKESSLVVDTFYLGMPGVSMAGGTPLDPTPAGKAAERLEQVGTASPGFTTSTPDLLTPSF